MSIPTSSDTRKDNAGLHSGSPAFCRLQHLDDAELKRHIGFIESLAGEMHRSVQEIVPLYEEVLETLSANARVSDYLPIFVCRRVKRILSRSNS